MGRGAAIQDELVGCNEGPALIHSHVLAVSFTKRSLNPKTEMFFYRVKH